jgi:predicted nucleic acid-binding protein
MTFTVFETTRWGFLRAASLYRFLRRKGATVNSFDPTIAAGCLENDLPLLTCNRRDFAPMAKYAGLKLA